MTDKDLYRELCEKEPTIPIFSRDWWLDAVCGEKNWDVIIIKRDKDVFAILPYYFIHGRFFTTIGMPSLTQTLGPWLRPSKAKYANMLSEQKDLMTELIDKLPSFDYFVQNFNYSITNWLPFYWKGFSQTTRYTYVIEDLNNLEEVFKNFSYAKIKNVKKAEKIVTVHYDLSASEFYKNHKMTLAKQGEEIIYSYELFERIYNSGYARDSARTIYAKDAEGNIHAALFVVWDTQSAYDLISTIDPDFRNSGAATLLIKEIIKYVATRTKKFDFEGSMNEGIENSFRQFGAVQKPYFSIFKTNSRLLKIKQEIMQLVKTILNK